MKIIDLLNELKDDGVTRLVGMHGTSDIRDYISKAEENHEISVKYAAEGIACHQYSLDHEDDFRMVTTPDGNRIIAIKFGDFEMPYYSTCETEEEMNAAFKEVQIAEQAESIAKEMDTKRPGVLPHAAWISIAAAELNAAYSAAEAAFKHDFPVHNGERSHLMMAD